MGNEQEARHRVLFFLVAFLIVLLSFFAAGVHTSISSRDEDIKIIHKTPYRFTQPQPPDDPKGTIMFGEQCGKPGKTKDLLDCVGKESYGYCLQGRCRQTGLRFENKCLCR